MFVIILVMMYQENWIHCLIFVFFLKKKVQPPLFWGIVCLAGWGMCVEGVWMGGVGELETRGRLGWHKHKVCTSVGKIRQYIIYIIWDVFLWGVVYFWTLRNLFAVCLPLFLLFFLLKWKIYTHFLCVLVWYGA
jgi:hypothetical protein